jgi:hypothetical protein
VLSIPDLFLTQKLGAPHVPQTVSGGPLTSSPRSGPVQNTAPVAIPLVLSENEEAPCAIPELMVEPDIFAPRRLSSSYSSAVRSIRNRAQTPDLDSSSSTASDTSDEVTYQHSIPTFRSRHINPNIVSRLSPLSIISVLI